MKKKSVVLAGLLAILAGCASAIWRAPGGATVIGEHAAYLVLNDSRLAVLPMPRLLAADTGQILYANLQAPSRQASPPRRRAGSVRNFDLDPGDENLSLPAPAPLAFAVAGKPHRIPARVQVSWKPPIRNKAILVQSQSVTPVRVALRRAIPADVLALIANQWRYRLDIVVSVQDRSARVGWRVVSFNEQSAHELRRGGYWPG